MSFLIKQRIRERTGSEEGAFHKPGSPLKVGLAYPNHYFFGMSNLGFQVLYHRMNQDDGTSCERLFLPEADLLPQHGYGSLIGYELETPAQDMAMVAFSISYQNDYLHFPSMLHLIGVKPFSRDRRDTDPLIIAGGPAVTINPEPVADFCDALVIGEGEEVIEEILAILKSTPSKTARLVALRQLEGVYVPSLFENRYGERNPADKANRGFGLVSGKPNGVAQSGEFVRRRVVQNPQIPLAHSTVLTPDTEFGDLYLLEVQRGCQWGCRFCAAGFMYRYPRYDKMEFLKQRIDQGLRYRKKLGLIAGDLLGHEEIHEILGYIDAQGGSFSPSSVRLNAFTPEIIHYLSKSQNRTIAIAPEAGSERLRRSLNKTFTDEEIVEAAVLLAQGGILNIKLYIMIGLPGENDEDIEELIALTLKTREALTRLAKRSGSMPSLTLSISPFTPKPSTPLQSVAFRGMPYLKAASAKIRKRLEKHGHIRFSGESSLNAYIETLLSRGDRRVSEFLLKATLPQGKALAVADSVGLKTALRSLSFDPERFVTREMPATESLPWDFIDHGIKKSFFSREFDKFSQGKITHYCMPEVCRACGVC